MTAQIAQIAHLKAVRDGTRVVTYNSGRKRGWPLAPALHTNARGCAVAYAENTTVAVEKSLGEIVALIKKAGGVRIAQMEDIDTLAVQFFMTERMLRFRVPVPTADDMDKHNGKHRYLEIPLADRQKKAEAARRQRARALLLVIKAKLESVESGVETFDEAFLPNIVMSDGCTVWERVGQPLALEYQTGKPMPFLLEGPRNA